MSQRKEKIKTGSRYLWTGLKELSEGTMFTPIKTARGKNILSEEGRWSI